MTNYVNRPAPSSPTKLSGTIRNYSVVSENASFVFTKTDKTKFGLIAVAASLAGMGAQATAMASNASAMEEEADYVQFDIEETRISGWLWRSPFKDGDIVDAAVEWRSDHFELLGMIRPADRTIALYPHCTRSLRTHYKNAFKWWIYFSLFFDVGMIAMFSISDAAALKRIWVNSLENGTAIFMLGLHIAFGVAIYSMTKQWEPFARVAEIVFSLLGMPDAKNTDLVKSSKGKHLPYDTMEFGVMYFRY